jgi:hypothetical protein
MEKARLYIYILTLSLTSRLVGFLFADGHGFRVFAGIYF